MSLPELLAGAVGDEDVVARVPLGGDDVLAVTPTRTLVYRAEGLLSDESVEEYPHDVERLDVSEGRRKAKITLHYGLDGERTVSVPTKRLDDVLHPVIAGVLSASNVTEPGESVLRTFRFSELTLVVTSHRVVKHIGSAVWDGDFEEFPYADLTGLDFEEGTVATSVVLAHGNRSERFKAPNDAARAVRETLADAVCEFYEVGSLEEFRLTVEERAAADAEAEAPAESKSTTDFGDGPDPLSASPVADAEEAEEAAESAEKATKNAETAKEPVRTTQSAETAETTKATTAATGGAGTEGGATGDTESTDPSDSPETANAGADGMTVSEAATGETEAADPLSGDPTTEPTEVTTGSDAVGAEEVESDAFEGSAFESAGVADDEALAAEVAALRETVENQSERLDRQSELIEKLIEELRRGR